MNYAKRTHHLVSEGAYQVLAKAQELEAQGRNIIHLEIGQPDFETFPNISQAGINAIQNGYTRYTPYFQGGRKTAEYGICTRSSCRQSRCQT